MKLTKIESFEVKNLEINIRIFFEKDKPTYIVEYSYDCPKCAGHGCNKHTHNNSECSNGSINEKLNLSDVDKIFSETEANEIKRIIGELKSKVSPKAFVQASRRTQRFP